MKLLKIIDHNPFKSIGLVLIAILCVVTLGCQSTTMGIFPEDGPVNREELEQQATKMVQSLEEEAAKIDLALATYNARLKMSEDSLTNASLELDRKDLQRTGAFNALGELALGVLQGGANPTSIVTGLLTIGGLVMGGTAAMDGRKKDKVILGLKKEPPKSSEA